MASAAGFKRTFGVLAASGQTSMSARCCAQRAELVTAAALYVVKVIRFMALWVGIYLMDKVWRDMYVQSVVDAGENGAPRPPSMRTLILAALGVELVFLCALVICVRLLDAAFGGGKGTSFVLDACFIRLVIIDYVATTALIIALAMALTSVAQNCKLFRYADDGLRGIRATCTLLLWVCGVALALPMYRLT